MIPKSIRSVLKQVLTLGFEDEPPYDEIIRKLNKELQKLKSESSSTYSFEWMQSQADQVKQHLIDEENKFENDEFSMN